MTDYPPEFDGPDNCLVCGLDVSSRESECNCPECPECASVGDPDCFGNPSHLPYRADSVQRFIEDRGFDVTLAGTMRAIDRHGDQSITLTLCGPFVPGADSFDHAHLASSGDSREVLAQIPLYARIVRITTGTHACGYDAEFTATCDPGDPAAYAAAQADVTDQVSDWWSEFGTFACVHCGVEIDAEGFEDGVDVSCQSCSDALLSEGLTNARP